MKILLATILILLTRIVEQSAQFSDSEYNGTRSSPDQGQSLGHGQSPGQGQSQGQGQSPGQGQSQGQEQSPGQSRSPTVDELEVAFNKARHINLVKKEIKYLERDDDKRKRGVLKCPLSQHHGTRNYGNTTAGRNANNAFLALRILMDENGYSLRDLQNNSLAESLKSIDGFKCDVPKPNKCNYKSKYRNIDGSCNNRNNPDWGMAGSIQQRVLPNDYDDKISLPRTKGLPNARTVSDIVHRNFFLSETLSKELTLHVMGFGQFLDHDIARTPEQDDVEDCCEAFARKDVDNCFNIIVPRGILGGTSDILVPGHCMEVKRSAPVFCPDDNSPGLSVRQQTTSLTSFVDASNVYGSSSTRLAELRERGTGYRLATSLFRKQERILNGPDDTCTLQDSTQSCSAAGDGRVNEVSILTSYHFLFVKEHNRIADVLKDYYSNNETIFQETRRIIIAIMQKIVYDEFLASVFSTSGLKKYQLESSARYVYESNTNPTMLNAFGIAYRVGHTWIPQAMRLFDRSLQKIYDPNFNRKTEDTFNNPDLTFQPLAFERLAYYMSGSQSPNTDRIIEEAVRSRLFIDRDNDIAFDLAALNIQRGRDHGLPSYNEYRKWCGLSSVSRYWNYFGGNSGLVDHSFKARTKLKLAGYRSPLDIDLFPGGLTETPVTGGQFGPTFECIIGRQFRRLKYADRFWYQNKDAQFTDRQILAIQNYTLSGILCNNYNFDMVHFPSAFLSKTNTLNPYGQRTLGTHGWFFPYYPPTNGNSTLTPCNKVPDLDISVFEPRFAAKSFSKVMGTNPLDSSSKSKGMESRVGKDEELIEELYEDIFEKNHIN